MIHRAAYVAVAGAIEGVEKVLRLTGFDELVGLYPDSASAASALLSRAKEFESRKGDVEWAGDRFSRLSRTVEAAADAGAWLARETGALGLAGGRHSR